MKIDTREKIVLLLILLAIKIVAKYGVNADIKEDLATLKAKIKTIED